MSITYEKITEIPLKTWQVLLNDSYSSIIKNKVVYWPSDINTDQDRAFYLLKAWNRTLAADNSFGFAGRDSTGRICCMGVAIRDEANVYVDKYTLWGRNYKGSRSYIYTQENTDSFCSFLSDNDFVGLLWTVAEGTKNETVFSSGDVPAPTKKEISYKKVTGAKNNRYTRVYMPL